MTLTEVIEALDKLRTESCMKFYSIGKLLKQVKEEKTYQERYRTFDEFLTREHWSKEGYMLMSIVDTFPNIESHLGKRIGYFKLRVMLPVARHSTDEQKKRMLKMAEVRSCQKLREDLAPFRERLHLPNISATLSFGVCDKELRNSVMEKLDTLMKAHNLHGSKAEALEILLQELINEMERGVAENE